jgi:small multidrug resistance pump
MNPYILMFFAIGLEIISTTALKASNGMSVLCPSMISLIGYPLCFWCLSGALKTLPVGMVYAVWSGIGIIGIAIAGMILFSESFGLYDMVGTSLILGGIFILMLIH